MATSNEIIAIPLLLRRLELQGVLVTIDAMGKQTRIAQTILDDGGDYVRALKQNRPGTCSEVEALFAAPPPAVGASRHQSIDSEHGRIATRTHYVCHAIAWLFSDRRYPGELAFPGLAMIGMVESHTQRDGKVEHERRYHLCSTRLDAETFARVARSHWGIENRLYWMLDVVFHDGLA